MPPIVLQIEVSESGLHATRDEITAFLAHESTRSEATAHLAFVVLRKMLMEAVRAEAEILKAAKAKEDRKPKVSVREMRRCA